VNEEKLDRRAHWVVWAVSGIILATGWCIRLEFTVSALKAQIDEQIKNRDTQISNIWTRFGQDHDEITRNGKDIEWLKRR